MSKSSSSHEALGREIESLVMAHLAASRAAAEQALERSFGRGQSSGSRAAARRGSAKRRASSPHRSAETIATLVAQLAAAVTAHPGSTMRELAAHLDATSPELTLPMAKLKKAGRVRRIGARQWTRYFPLAVADEAEGPTGD